MSASRLPERVAAAGQFLVDHGGTATPGEVGAALELNRNQQQAVLNHLREQGLVQGPKGQVELTAEGRARFGGLGRVSAGPVLDEALAQWPARPRAFVELLVCAVIARHHLRSRRPRPTACFVAVGNTGVGKTAMAEVLCRLFGFDPLTMARQVPSLTPRLVGRRERDSAGGWTFEPSSLTRQPFVLLDEFDKAEAAVQAATWLLFDASAVVVVEDERVDLAPVPLLVANPPRSGDRLAQVHPAVRRRGVVLDVGARRDYRPEQLRALAGAYAWQPDPRRRLVLEQLVPPAVEHLEVRQWMDEAAEACLVDDGVEEFIGAATLEVLTLGRMALLGPDVSWEVAAAQTLAAYLTVTESLPGQVDPRWSGLLGQWAQEVQHAPGAASLAAAVARTEQARAESDARVARTRRARAQVSAQVAEEAAALAERCRLAWVAIDGRALSGATPEQKAAAAGLRKVLKQRQTKAAHVSSRTGLEEEATLAADPLRRAQELRAEVDRYRDQRRRDHEIERQAIQQAREEAKQHRALARTRAAAARAEQQRALAQVRAQAKQLERLYARTSTKPGESPLATLDRVRMGGQYPVLTYRAVEALPAASRFERFALALGGAREQPGEWVALDGRAFPGSRLGCAALASWGPNTRAVLAPPLRSLHEAEDQLVAALGVKPRTSRPEIPGAQLQPSPTALPAGRFG